MTTERTFRKLCLRVSSHFLDDEIIPDSHTERQGRGSERGRGREGGREGEGARASERGTNPTPNQRKKTPQKRTPTPTPTPTIPHCFQHPMFTAAQTGARPLAWTAPRGKPLSHHLQLNMRNPRMSRTQTRETERQGQGGHTQVVASAPHCARQSFLAGVFVCRSERRCAVVLTW